MLRLIKQEYGLSPPEIPEILTIEKKGALEVRVSLVNFYGPGGIEPAICSLGDCHLIQNFLTTTCFSDNIVTLYLKISNEFINN